MHSEPSMQMRFLVGVPFLKVSHAPFPRLRELLGLMSYQRIQAEEFAFLKSNQMSRSAVFLLLSHSELRCGVLQCESIAAGLQAPPASSRRMDASNNSVSSKLGAAVRAENDQFITSEQDQQQLLLRFQPLPALENNGDIACQICCYPDNSILHPNQSPVSVWKLRL